MISVVQELLFANADVQSKYSSAAKVHVQCTVSYKLPDVGRDLFSLYILGFAAW